jgi:hypothetical protein
MKKTFAIASALTRSIRPALAAAALLCATAAQAQFNSPVGTWDFIITGAERGVAYITFEDDFTLSGYEVVTPAAPKSPKVNESRGDDSIGRYITSSGSSGTVTKTNLVGFGHITGFWTFDTKGRVVGIYTEGNDNIESCTTNEVVVTSFETNVIDGITFINISQATNFVTTCTTNAVTNGISFSAVVRPGTRMVIKTMSPVGRYTLKGVPAQEVPDFSGFHMANAKSRGLRYTELFLAEPSFEFPNAFLLAGAGPGYEFWGVGVLSSQRHLALVSNGGAAGLNAVTGPYNFRRETGTLKGSDMDGNRITYRVARPVFQ